MLHLLLSVYVLHLLKRQYSLIISRGNNRDVLNSIFDRTVHYSLGSPQEFKSILLSIQCHFHTRYTYRIVSNKRSPSNKRPLTYFQIKLGKMPKFLYGVSL